MKQKITLKQIAKELDVSISTVSKALRNSLEIGEDTREKVQAFAKLYNYRPNNIALSLKNSKTKTIGVIIPEIVHYFFSNVISGIEKIANQKGYNVIVGLSNESFDKEVLNMQMLANGSIDGFILSVAKDTMMKEDYHHFIETINQGMPIVMFDRVIPQIPCDKVIIDDKRSARTAVLKLIDNGCKNIAIVTTKDYINVGKLRTDGYIEALNLRGIEVKDENILKLSDYVNDEAQLNHLEDQVEEFLKDREDIDGILGVNEIYALTVIKIAKKLGRRVPDDIQVISYTDGVLSRHATPSLTTVKQHGQTMGEKAAELLINKLEKDDEDESYETMIIETELIERDSTK
ncbi:LacI family DNA-binding transcriptional regulator [Aegicerativicinus sediminis]|uniref:LacI family DNA-binding transcriptional regulator n=1 Tax=Aegicerativicinus sediminis TaxID=2893202 RepID=UPI001E364617|nr:LacI family DNA-binding transcriptional regulator [Aegicerativicinus sediminis]